MKKYIGISSFTVFEDWSEDKYKIEPGLIVFKESLSYPNVSDSLLLTMTKYVDSSEEILRKVTTSAAVTLALAEKADDITARAKELIQSLSK